MIENASLLAQQADNIAILDNNQPSGVASSTATITLLDRPASSTEAAA
jgi:hypothetical protein